MFSKLNGDIVLVPAFYHHDYLLAMTFDSALKAQVTSSQNLSFSLQSYLVMEELWIWTHHFIWFKDVHDKHVLRNGLGLWVPV